ncbi:MAG TPA: ATP-binding protein, partial [Chthoniobacteraceae bacterium]|nr:ATP-binding protein [Chthoniobacteraceae bacterium]
VISNLLQNAAKFTPHGGEVHAHLSKKDERAVLSIHDTGMGMTEETIRRLFEPFNQADTSLDRSRGGLGLGLALVKGLVSLHEGSVRAESPGLSAGATLTIELPLTEKRPSSRSEKQQVPSTGRRIVIVEDNADAATTLARLLKRRGHAVVTAANGADGIDGVRQHVAEVLLCDVGLPGELDGYAVARRLRQEPGSEKILMIALTGYGQDQDQQRAKEAGFNHHLTKPISLEQIEAILAGWQR